LHGGVQYQICRMGGQGGREKGGGDCWEIWPGPVKGKKVAEDCAALHPREHINSMGSIHCLGREETTERSDCVVVHSSRGTNQGKLFKARLTRRLKRVEEAKVDSTVKRRKGGKKRRPQAKTERHRTGPTGSKNKVVRVEGGGPALGVPAIRGLMKRESGAKKCTQGGESSVPQGKIKGGGGRSVRAGVMVRLPKLKKRLKEHQGSYGKTLPTGTKKLEKQAKRGGR